MQAVGLANRDDFLARHNVSVDTDDLVDYIRKLTFVWKQFKLYHFMSFDDILGVDFAEILGPSGFCYNFNLIGAEELYHLEG